MYTWTELCVFIGICLLSQRKHMLTCVKSDMENRKTLTKTFELLTTDLLMTSIVTSVASLNYDR